MAVISMVSKGPTIGKFGKTSHKCNQNANELFDQYCDHFHINPRQFQGVELDEFPKLEKYYEVQLFMMNLKEDGSAKNSLPFTSLVSY